MHYLTYVLGVPSNFRGESLCKSLRDFGIAPEIVFGPEIETDFELIQKSTNNDYAIFTIRRRIKPQEVACCLGHLRMYARFFESRAEWGIFLEDDAICIENPKSLLEKMPITNRPCHIFLHDGPGTNLNLWSAGSDPLSGLGMIRRLDPQYGAYGYALNRAAVGLILKSKTVRYINTTDWPYLWPRRIKFYKSDKVFFMHPEDMSMSIIGERVNAQAQLINQLPSFFRFISGVKLGIGVRETFYREVTLKLIRLTFQIAKKIGFSK